MSVFGVLGIHLRGRNDGAVARGEVAVESIEAVVCAYAADLPAVNTSTGEGNETDGNEALFRSPCAHKHFCRGKKTIQTKSRVRVVAGLLQPLPRQGEWSRVHGCKIS